MTTRDLENIELLIKRLNTLPKIVDLRVKIKWEEITKEEKDLLLQTYKDLDDLLNDTLAFINVKFPNRKDLIQNWNTIDFNSKVGSIIIDTNSPEIIRSNWHNGLHSFEHLLKNLRREIILLIDKETIVDEKSNPTKNKWERSHKIGLASLFIALIVLIFGNNLYDRFVNSENNQKQISLIETKKITTDTVLIIEELPYLNNFPIIDNGLYVKYYYSELIVGGVNIDSIQINSRTSKSEPIELRKGKNQVSMNIKQEPFIEFKYKDKYYSIEMTGKHYEFKMILKEITKPTMDLKWVYNF